MTWSPALPGEDIRAVMGTEFIVDGVPRLVGESIRSFLESEGYRPVDNRELWDWLGETISIPLVVTQFLDGSKISAIRNARVDSIVVAWMPQLSAKAYAEALIAGATVAIELNTPRRSLLVAVHAAADGMTLMPTDAATAISRRFRSDPPIELTDREIDWIRALSKNTSIEKLAARNAYSQRHFVRLLKAVYWKLGSSNRIEAITAAAAFGLLDD